MKKSIVLLFAFFAIALSSNLYAQKNKIERKKEMKANAQEFKNKLNLTPDQETKLKEIRKRHREEVKAKLASNPNASKEEKRKMMREAMESADKEITAMLTPEQQVIYKEEKERRKNERIAKMKEKRAEGKGKGKSSDDKELEDAIMEGL